MSAQAPTAYPSATGTATGAPNVSVQQAASTVPSDIKSQQAAVAAVALQHQAAAAAPHNVSMPIAHGGVTVPPGFAYPANMVFTAPDPGLVDDQPTYVNPKQYARILKRRESRKKQTGTDVTSYTPRKRSYMHESRHKHAMQRRRGPGGRFLSKQERADLVKEADKQANNANVSNETTNKSVPTAPAQTAAPVPPDGSTNKDA